MLNRIVLEPVGDIQVSQEISVVLVRVFNVLVHWHVLEANPGMSDTQKNRISLEPSAFEVIIFQWSEKDFEDKLCFLLFEICKLEFVTWVHGYIIHVRRDSAVLGIVNSSVSVDSSGNSPICRNLIGVVSVYITRLVFRPSDEPL